jgi:hypothetical protein
MGMTRLVVFTPSFRSNSATLIICAFATPLRFTVTRVVPLITSFLLHLLVIASLGGTETESLDAMLAKTFGV